MAFLDLLMASEENSDMNDELLRNEVSTFMAAVSNGRKINIMERLDNLTNFKRYFI